jgi:4-diphosphocytidyl-2-C-methyl-D-erythritol kinase
VNGAVLTGTHAEGVQTEHGALATRAPAKLNLSLKVVGRRADGYHELVSLVAFAGAGDRLSLRPSARSDVSLDVSGRFAAAIDGDNLVLRAARLFLETLEGARGGHFHLEKRLPVAAGLGGGSSDAAAAVRLLAHANASDERSAAQSIRALSPALSRLGADIPVCLGARTAWMSGMGERIEPLETLPEIYAVLVNPGLPLATRDVFAALSAPTVAPDGPSVPDMPAAFADLDDLVAFVAGHPNDLEPPACVLAPVIGTVLRALGCADGCRIARLSGSGPTCYGLFGTPAEADAAASSLVRTHPDWWVMTARLM